MFVLLDKETRKIFCTTVCVTWLWRQHSCIQMLIAEAELIRE